MDTYSFFIKIAIYSFHWFPIMTIIGLVYIYRITNRKINILLYYITLFLSLLISNVFALEELRNF